MTRRGCIRLTQSAHPRNLASHANIIHQENVFLWRLSFDIIYSAFDFSFCILFAEESFMLFYLKSLNS